MLTLCSGGGGGSKGKGVVFSYDKKKPGQRVYKKCAPVENCLLTYVTVLLPRQPRAKQPPGEFIRTHFLFYIPVQPNSTLRRYMKVQGICVYVCRANEKKKMPKRKTGLPGGRGGWVEGASQRGERMIRKT